MAKQTRAQRRARRAEQVRQEGNGGEVRAARPTQMRAAEAPAVATERHLPGSGFRRFVGESAAELKKVEWPSQPQLIQGVAVVLIACAVVGTYLWLADLVFKRLVQHVFLGQ
ncbi:MAG: preprotein translocase subunit SecE [Gaiellaceae bacterium]